MDENPLLFDLPPITNDRVSRPAAKARALSEGTGSIRSRIVAYLTETRSIAQVGKHINRSSSVAAHHLSAMCINGLVVRVGCGQYVRADQHIISSEPPPIFRREQPIRDKIMAYLTDTRSAKKIAEHIERKTSVATGHLRAMRIRGLVVRVGWGQYIRADRCSNPPDPTTIKRGKSLFGSVF